MKSHLFPWLGRFPNGWIPLVLLYCLGLSLASAAAYFLVAAAEKRWNRNGNIPFTRRLFLPVEILLMSLSLLFLPGLVRLPAEAYPAFRVFTRILLIFSGTFFLLRAIDAMTAAFLRNLKVDKPDNLRERRLRTQVLYMEKVLDAVVILVAVGLLLLGFERFRKVGGSLLASAGLASLIVGFAAQRSLGNLIAGLQIAFTQPIRLGDAVFIENEWGEIEEITFTYVVVRIWDLRRLVVPINYFLEKPFQNWTRTSAELLGFVLLSVDYCTPVEPVRKEFFRLLEGSPLWDRKVRVLQVVDSNEKTMTLRALMSAKSAGAAWDLRCEVREKLLAFLRDQLPSSLPRSRIYAFSAEEAL